jgi:hypothetical protein
MSRPTLLHCDIGTVISTSMGRRGWKAIVSNQSQISDVAGAMALDVPRSDEA